VAEKVLINLATGMEDGERVLVAFLVVLLDSRRASRSSSGRRRTLFASVCPAR
jgi:hypothetical protein